MGDARDPRKTPEADPAPEEVGLYAPAKRYSRDIPAHETGMDDAPVVKGSEPARVEPDEERESVDGA